MDVTLVCELEKLNKRARDDQTSKTSDTRSPVCGLDAEPEAAAVAP